MALRFQKEIWERLTRRLFSRPGRFPRAGGLSACAGSAGAGAQAVNVDGAAALEETPGDYAVIHGRKFQPLPLRCQDFTQLWRDLELAGQMGLRFSCG